MTKNQKRVLFLISILFFVLGAPLIILYSQGYRIDFDKKKIVQVGAFYLRISPRSSQIVITPEGKSKEIAKSSDFIFGTILIENLLPGNYDIEVSKPNYHSWRKMLEVKEALVTDIKNITLIPQKIIFKEIDKNIINFFPLPEKNKLLLEKEILGEKRISLFDIKSGTEEILITSDNLPSSILSDIIFIDGIKKFVLVFENNYFFFSDENQGKIQPIIFDGNILKISKLSEKADSVLILSDKGLFSYDLKTKKSILIIKDTIAFSPDNGNEIFWIDSNGYFYKGITNPQKFSRDPLNVSNDSKCDIYFPRVSEIIVKINDSYFLFDEKSKDFKEVLHSSGEPIISPDQGKILHCSNYEIGVLFLSDTSDQPRRNHGEDIFLTRFSEKIDKCFWFTSHYVLLNVENEIKIMEIDNRDNLNIVDIGNFYEPKIYFNFSGKNIYLLTENKLLVSEKLIP